MNRLENNAFFDNVPDFLQLLFTKTDYPWQIIPLIKEYAIQLIDDGIDGYSLIKDGVLVGRKVDIHESATIGAPAIIGEGAVIRPGAYIRGSVIISPRCVIGNSTEIKNSVLLTGAQAPHYNYVGDSVLGSHSHLGAGAICSNLKADKSSVTVHADRGIDTGLRKLGAILGDGAEIGCGCVLNPGTVVGKHTTVYPLTSLRGVYPPNSIVKSANVIVEKKLARCQSSISP